MTHIQIQQLNQHIRQLEGENSRLQSTIDRYHTHFQQICELSGCSTWTVFLGWLFEHFNGLTDKTHESKHMGNQVSAQSLKKLQIDLFREINLPSISQEASESTSQQLPEPMVSLEVNARLTKSILVASESIKNELASELVLSDIDCIIIENTRLRRQNNTLSDELFRLKESLKSMAFVLKVYGSGGITNASNSTHNSIISYH